MSPLTAASAVSLTINLTTILPGSRWIARAIMLEIPTDFSKTKFQTFSRSNLLIFLVLHRLLHYMQV